MIRTVQLYYCTVRSTNSALSEKSSVALLYLMMLKLNDAYLLQATISYHPASHISTTPQAVRGPTKNTTRRGHRRWCTTHSLRLAEMLR